jgi:hypothetical protein
MDSNVQPSFIPKKPLTQPTGPRPHHSVSFFSIIATVVFFTSILIAGGVFGYKYFLNKQLTEKKADLKTSLKSFEPMLINDLGRLDARLLAAKELMDNHFAMTGFFDVLEQATLRNVRFMNFAFTTTAEASTVNMTGEAASFVAVALQADEFQKQDIRKYINNVVITNPNLASNGNVSFSLTGTIELKNLSYGKLMKTSGVSLTSSTTPASLTASTTPATASTTPTTATTTSRTTGSATSTAPRATSTNATRR